MEFWGSVGDWGGRRGGGMGGWANERPGTDHVTSGPMIGLEKTALDGANTNTQPHMDGHGNSMTESAQWG